MLGFPGRPAEPLWPMFFVSMNPDGDGIPRKGAECYYCDIYIRS